MIVYLCKSICLYLREVLTLYKCLFLFDNFKEAPKCLHMLFYTESLYPHAFVRLTNFIMYTYLGDSTVHITESGKVISKICIFLSFSETVCFVVRRLC